MQNGELWGQKPHDEQYGEYNCNLALPQVKARKRMNQL